MGTSFEKKRRAMNIFQNCDLLQEKRGRKSLIAIAQVGNLEGQLDVDQSLSTFGPLTISAAATYGKCKDGKKALDKILLAFIEGNFVGADVEKEIYEIIEMD